ncbi:MAG: hypothetical protein WD512_19460, partial [Candidatus Paceibacterota bacterium]
MVTIELSQKLFKLTKIKQSTDENIDEDLLFRWYINLFYFNGKKAVICLNHLTRYPILIMNLQVSELRDIVSLLTEHIRQIWLLESIPEEIINKYLENFYQVTFTKSSNRSLISTANELQRMGEYYL